MKWPAHRTENRPWVSRTRQGSKNDRLLDQVEVSVPPMISQLPYDTSGAVASEHDSALIAVSTLEAGFGRHLAPLSDFLLRSESVASSKIEYVDAGWRAFAKAVAGGKASTEARSQLAALHALRSLVDAVRDRDLEVEALLTAHRLLMSPDFYSSRDSGAFRVVQNWIGGSDYTPLHAQYVPPPPDLVPALMDDLLAFAGRTELPIVAQAAIAHAQFESIHPFTDGNGRIGRALISAVLRRRGLTDQVTVPIASVMLADTQKYFRHLDAYRAGDVDSLVSYVSNAATRSCSAAETAAHALSELPARWRLLANPRANSADANLVDALLDSPIINADAAQAITGTTEASTYRALARLTDAGVLEIVSDSKRNRIWAAVDVMAELDALTNSIGRRSLE